MCVSKAVVDQCYKDAKTITQCHKDKVDAKSDAALARRDLERVEKQSRAALEKKDAAIIALNARYDDRPDVVRWVGGTLVGVCVAGALINTYVPGEEWTMFNAFTIGTTCAFGVFALIRGDKREKSSL